MRVFLLVCMVGLFLSRIKETPPMLSENRYYEKVRKFISGNERFLNEFPHKTIKYTVIISKVAMFTYFIFVGLIYAAMGIISDSIIITILSLLQISTVMITMWLQKDMILMDLTNLHIDDFPFYKWYFLFNVVLDYIYYPLAIFMILK